MLNKRKYLFLTMSGLGYLFPSIRLAHILQTNLHHVLFVSTYDHSMILANYGIEHVPMRSSKRRFLDLHRWGYPESAANDLKVVEEIINRYRPDVIVTSSLAMISFILAEKYKIPLIVIGFCEYLFPGKIDNDTLKQWRINQFTEAYNMYRTEVGMSLIENSNTESPLIGTKYLLRSVPLLNDDLILPDKVECIGDLYFEPEYINKQLSQFIAESLAHGRRIGYIQLGRLFKSTNMWGSLLSVLAQLPMNFIIDTGRADYSISLAKMHPNFFTSHFIPIGAIKDHIDFVICTGQTTSVVSAIIHGKQILAIPHSADSIELSKRLERKKLALSIYNEDDLHIDNLQELLKQLNNSCLMPSIVKFQKLFLSYTDDIIYDKIKLVK